MRDQGVGSRGRRLRCLESFGVQEFRKLELPGVWLDGGFSGGEGTFKEFPIGRWGCGLQGSGQGCFGLDCGCRWVLGSLI